MNHHAVTFTVCTPHHQYHWRHHNTVIMGALRADTKIAQTCWGPPTEAVAAAHDNGAGTWQTSTGNVKEEGAQDVGVKISSFPTRLPTTDSVKMWCCRSRLVKWNLRSEQGHSLPPTHISILEATPPVAWTDGCGWATPTLSLVVLNEARLVDGGMWAMSGYEM